MKKLLCLLLSLLMLLPVFVSCKDDAKNPAGTTGSDESSSGIQPTEDDRFAGTNFHGQTLNIQNSNGQATLTMATSNIYIEGEEELTGDAALDSVIRRNQSVEEYLNVDLVFYPVDIIYNEVPAELRQLVLSGDRTYQVIINDIWGCVPMTAEGIFRNIYTEGAVFDFNEPWWYDDFMTDISLDVNKRYTLAGDFFIDQLRNTECLIMNKSYYEDLYGDPNDVYQTVLDQKWTIDAYNQLVANAFFDLDGDGDAGPNDRYVSIGSDEWGCCIPWLIAGDPGFITRDEDGFPVIAIDNDNAYTLVDLLRATYRSAFFCNSISKDDSEQVASTMFTSGQGLFLWGNRLGSLETDVIRKADDDIAVLPYPKRDDSQKDYVTSIHDTTEMGFIPVTVTDEEMPFVSTVLEVLCRETNRQVLPVYYESSLKIKYTRDKLSGQMIDIIHDHYGNGFALAWSDCLNDIFMEKTLYPCVAEDSPKLASKIKSQMKAANAKLKKLIEQTEKLYD